MRYMMCAAAMMLLAIATTGCQFAGSNSGCADCGRGSSPIMGDPGCGCNSDSCAGRGAAAKGNGKGTLLGSLFGTGSGSACQNGSCGLNNRSGNRGGCNGNCNGGGMNGGAGMAGANMNGGFGGGMHGAGMNGGFGGGMNGPGMNGGFGGGMNGPGMNGGAGGGFSMAQLQGCNNCMGQGRPCARCLAPGGRLAALAAHCPHCGTAGCVCKVAQGVVNHFAGHDCQTPYTVPYAEGGMGMGGPGAGGPVPTYGYPYYTTRAPRDFLMANPPSIGP